MQATNFEYAGERLEDRGFIICNLGTEDAKTISSDSQLVFDKISQMNGKFQSVTVSYYDKCIEIDLLICKRFCDLSNIEPITLDESRDIKRWLNRPTIHKLKLGLPGWEDIYLEGSFNVNNVTIDGETFLLELKFISNSALAFHEPVRYKFNTENYKNGYSILDISDEIGYIYPDIKIKCLSDGELKIHNSNENRDTIIKNCKKNEIITFNKNLVFFSSESNHKIQDDFNYVFFRISNSYNNRENRITSSIPIEIEISYSPFAKVVI